MTQDTKPCGCGQPGCLVTRHAGESQSKFARRRFADRTCSANHRSRQMSPEERAMRSRAMLAAAKRGGIKDEISAGALVTHSAWLYTDSGRIKAQRQAHGVVLP